MLRQRLSQKYSNSPYGTPKTHHLKEEKPNLSERRLAVYGIILSLLVIAGKILTSYRDSIEKAFLERRLISYEVLSEDGQIMFIYAWKTVVKYSNFWVPAVCGLLSTYFTWIMVYLDSNVPGIQPPSPFSPKKFKDQSGHAFHLNYVFAVLIGILVFLYMYFKGILIQY